MSASHLLFPSGQGNQCGVSASAGGWWTLAVAARQTRLVIDGCACPRADEEEAMSTAEPLGEDRWPATGVDLETRRRRILATLTALGRTKDVEQFQRALAAATKAAADTQNYGGLEGVVQGWY